MACCQGKILLDAHTWGRASHRILEKTADCLGSDVVRLECNILVVQNYFSAVSQKRTADCIEQRGLSGPVCSDYGDEISVLDLEIHMIQSNLFKNSLGIEGLADIDKFKHDDPPLKLF